MHIHACNYVLKSIWWINCISFFWWKFQKKAFAIGLEKTYIIEVHISSVSCAYSPWNVYIIMFYTSSISIQYYYNYTSSLFPLSTKHMLNSAGKEPSENDFWIQQLRNLVKMAFNGRYLYMYMQSSLSNLPHTPIDHAIIVMRPHTRKLAEEVSLGS